ncbi:EAL and HDOD domain-containing protein [Variovorax sp. PAMC 28711]|uniref:EAL and HDOD domain-containing protein n=1 Tax=Variovorax sp. PAMC 28711 TaxID=1795631 RepID=UPI0009E7AC1D|nr:HDOD domain-containing protein [Variovorax sp. PAMC 28711]
MSTRIQESPLLATDVVRGRPPMGARRVVVDHHRAVAGYQLAPSLRGPKPTDADGVADEDPTEDESRLLKPTFVRCTCQELAEGELDWLDPDTVVLQIQESAAPGKPAVPLDHAVLQAARDRGFQLAFDSRLLGKAYAAFVPLASFVILEMGVLELNRATAVAHAVLSGTRATLFATQVRTAAEFECLAEAGVTLYEGLWFTQPPATPDRSIRLGHASLISLMNMVMREADIHEIEDLLKREPTVAFKLLRYINSAGFGRKTEIGSFRHAVLTVGMKRLFRWTAVLVASTAAGSVAPAAGTLAIVRGRVMELLALGTLSPAEADLAFVTGMFSMLDLLLGMPLADALALVNLPASVSDAVLRNDGPFARYLGIARGCESADEATLEILSARYGIPVARMTAAHLEALAWAEQFGR